MLIDTHAHLNFRAYDSDREAVIKRCREKKMSVINVGAQFVTSQKAVELAGGHDFMYAAVGVHPIHVYDEPFNSDKYQKLITPKVVAIGETGLDFWHLKFIKEPYKVVLLHGWEGTRDSRFFVWLDEQLTKRGYQVIRFNLPNTALPKQEEWLKEIRKQIGYANRKTILIGFSLGGVAALRLLETFDEDEKVGAVFLLGTPYNELGYREIANFFKTDFDWPKAKETCERFFVYNSDDDEVVPLDHGKKFTGKLEAVYKEFRGKGHFEVEQLPEITEEIDDLVSDLNRGLPAIEQVIEKQKEIFIEQIELAKKNKLALICHGRDGLEGREVYQEMLEILLERKAERAVMHSYGGSLAIAKEIISHGYYIGITGPVTFKKKAEELQRIGREIPLDKILIETDCPYMTPEPHRGERNEPAYVEFVAAKIAELKNISKEEVIEQSWQNAKELFKI